MKNIKISFAPFNQPWQHVVYPVEQVTINECLQLSKKKDFDQFDYWRKCTGDNTIEGHVMIWQEYP